MKNISIAETEILKVIWEKGTSTSKEIADELTHCKWSRNTVNTLIKRLCEKKVLNVIGRNGKSFLYESFVSKEEFQKQKLEELLSLAFDGKIENLIKFYKK